MKATNLKDGDRVSWTVTATVQGEPFEGPDGRVVVVVHVDGDTRTRWRTVATLRKAKPLPLPGARGERG